MGSMMNLKINRFLWKETGYNDVLYLSLKIKLDNRLLIQDNLSFSPISRDNIKGKVYFHVNLRKD